MAIKHLHTYRRSKTNSDIYRCLDPDCTHYTHREFIEGKRALCGKCRSEFIVSKEQLKNALPVCINCSHSNAAKAHRGVKTELEKILSAIGMPTGNEVLK